MGHARQPGCAGFFHRLLAAACAVIIFALGVFAASPVLHEQLHHDPQTASVDHCAIVLFASGTAVPQAVSAMAAPSRECHTQTYPRTSEIFVESLRYRFQPGRGPPVG